MIAFIGKRLAQAVITMIAVTIAVFLLSHSTGNPADVILPIEAAGEERAALIDRLGLNKPLPEQYWIFVSNAAQGNFERSIRTRSPVMELVGDRFWNSIKLATAAMGFTIVVSLPLGVIAAVRRGRWADKGAMTFATMGQSLPPFFTGVLSILVFAVWLQLLPAQGADSWKHYVLPAVTMGWFTGAGVTRLMRSGMLSVLDSEYIKLARAKGTSETKVIWKHAMRNALIPVVTFIGLMYGILLAAAVSTEVVFGWPGMGRLAFEAVSWRDFPLLQAVVLVWSLVIIGINLLIDLSYGILDPRIRR
ncbi:MAG: ABC transporter permease [bacterium]|nr:ABC transporter permease [bacterium]